MSTSRRHEADRRFLCPSGCFVPTIHPCFSGRPSRAEAVDELVPTICATDGVWVAMGSEIAAHVESLRLPSRHHTPITLPPEAG